MSGKRALTIERYFSDSETKPFDRVKWETCDVNINDDSGKEIFVQSGSEFPTYFSFLARQIVASRYAYGQLGSEERETSLKSIIGRVSETYGQEAVKRGYFGKEDAQIFTDEIAEITLHQRFAFNSPVWFNVGVGRYPSAKTDNKTGFYAVGEDGIVKELTPEEAPLHPQTSACFIQSVDDTMEDILDLAKREGRLFKYGSGTGTNLSSLRSFRERLSGGGVPSGPLAYEKFYDDVAGIVKSGGKTRRAAKMNELNIEHPDIMEFIVAKRDEEKKAMALVKAGYSVREASESVSFQNANFSVSTIDEFLQAVEDDDVWKTIPVHSMDLADEMPMHGAKKLLETIAEAAWGCGDPGIQYRTTMNIWNTVKNTGKINGTNPCSEYVFLDDTSCNLSSLNLRRFQKVEGGLEVEDFEKAIEVMTIAMDLNYEFSAFPTERIAQKSYDNRTLGVGYTNLGALLMVEGLAYDSDEGRAVAAVVTALMAGKVYETSTMMAESLGTFKNYEENKEPMMEVMHMHRSALDGIDLGNLPEAYRSVFERAKEVWDNVLERGEKYGFRNAQGTVLAPTGTISFMMDCDTTGIEPDLGLVKIKNLSEGGLLKIVNQTVPLALGKLGYDENQINSIKKYIYENETIEGAPHLRAEDLPIFDCSFKPVNGKRSINWKAHLKMMAAAQPFLSGAISKTINMPADSTPVDIAEAYMMGWKLGLKALAIYRDGSKAWQAYETGAGPKKAVSPSPANRVKLPTTRNSTTHKFTLSGHDVYATVGHYDDGKPGELFLTMSKEGSTLRGMMDAFATSVSMGLQSGVPIGTYVKKFMGASFEPNGWVEEGDKERIHQAKSIIDYLFRWMGYQYVPGFGEVPLDDNNSAPVVITNGKLEETVSGENPRNGNSKTPKGPLAETFCANCGSKEHTYKLGDCLVYCDINFGGCGFQDPKGCGG